eukprot:CAMPEP_0170188704 /NCGR_PEP_ID=MMETSP0040_2-20121228/45001_1 /TAXON_ID=641309 /ORGANISM="Lotharella oceanica, Strain CCMP622" /LENGTH=327 /DNA_ID=CAMNT_0010436059 /DNA_START=99 /DNA_END=1082 /DNA_ORIENTATION=-
MCQTPRRGSQAAEANASSFGKGVVLKSEHIRSRSSIDRKDRHCPKKPIDGVVWQLSTLDQFHKSFRSLIDKYHFPRAACGAFSVANSILLRDILQAKAKASSGEFVLTQKEIRGIVERLQDIERVTEEVTKVMASIYNDRLKYTKDHAQAFPTPNDVEKYLRDWVANYEISDYLIKEMKGQTEDVGGIHFVRYNQYPERNGATFEEKARLAEEKRFGGHKFGDKARVELEEGAARFLIEPFVPERKLCRPEEWMDWRNKLSKQKSSQSPFQIFVLDLNGHFCTAFSCFVKKAGTGKEASPHLVMINTTNSSYISSGAPCAAYDIAFS